jgi:predicted Zn finger-like uncharacterized protein
VIIACPKCKSRYQVKDGSTLEKVRCKKCQEAFDVKSNVVTDTGAGAATAIGLTPPGTGQAKTVVTTPPPGTKPPAAPQTQAKTVVTTPPPGTKAPAAAPQAKTVITTPPPSKPPATPAQSQAKTVVTTPPPQAQVKTVVTTPQAPSAPAAAEPSAAGVEEPDPLVGKMLGGYQVLRKLGQGGMGAVYEARQIALDRSVALKVLPAELAANKAFILRFTREALSVAKLNHNNIIQIYDVGKADGTYFFAMEFVRGTTLQRIVEKEGKIEPATAVGYIIQAARGLEYAHRKNIIHRDIKPDNIMLNEEGIAKVADLGLAKDVQDQEASMTMAGIGMGTPHYMSPEQATDAKNCDARADIYSLGCTLYHLLAGRVPYDGGSAYEIITKHVQEPLPPPHTVVTGLPEDLSAIITKMMGKKKEERYASMAEVIAALEGYLGVSYAAKGFQPSEEQIASLRTHAEAVGAARKDLVGTLALAGLAAATVLLLALSFRVSWRMTVAMAVFALAAPAAIFLVNGFQRKTYVYRRVRNYFFSQNIVDWLILGVSAVVVIAGIVLLNLIWQSVLALVLAFGAAIGFYAGLKRPVLAREEAAMEEFRKFIRDLRRKGIPEEDLQLFICQHGGRNGEYLCEEMFGHEAAVATRSKRTAQEVEQRPMSAKLRDWFILKIDVAEAKRGRGPLAAQAAAAAAGVPGAPGATPAPGAENQAAEQYLAELDQKPGIGKILLRDGPRFLVGAKGRFAVGAVMLLLAVLAWKGILFGGSEGLKSLNYALFGFAVLASSFGGGARFFLGGCILCCIFTGPVAIFMAGPETFFGQTVAQLTANVPVLGSIIAEMGKVVPAEVMDKLTPTAIFGALSVVAGLVAQFVFHR